MPVTLQNADQLFSPADAERLWQATIAHTKHADDEVTVKVVSKEEIQRLNSQYGGKDVPTNVLTFSYPPEQGDGSATHDVALCWSVTEQEAIERDMAIRDYAALLLVHAFLHAVGLDHERSPAEAETTEVAEQAILQQAGFAAHHL